MALRSVAVLAGMFADLLPELLPVLVAVGSGRLKPRLRALRATKSAFADWGTANGVAVGWRMCLPECLPILLPELLPGVWRTS
ncbi:MAG: hypothetical protein ACXVCO_08825 [Ktedonobacterales bacterium]